MNGLGNRFRDDDYHMPKPLIMVLGKPMIFWLLDNLNLDLVDQVIVPYTTLLDNFNFQQQLRDKYKNIRFRFFPINANTKGAAETVNLALELLDDETLSKNIMIMDCDTFYFEDVIKKYAKSKHKNNIFYFDDHQEYAIYSYIEIGQHDQVTAIKEKVKISNNANCGIYCFESGMLLRKYCDRLLNSNRTAKGEYYISCLYELMLEDQISIGSVKISQFNCVGTPMQLKIFCETHSSSLERFCFDLDGTLVTKPVIEGNYSSCLPIEKNINLLKHLKNLGHYIIIHTARRMRTHHGNIGRVIQDIGLLTQQQLENLGIPYDELVFGKPYAGFYIDDHAINCNLNLEKQLGYYNSTIKSRSFNNIELMNSMVIKTGRIDGEKYYYQELKRYPQVVTVFPKLLDVSKDKIIIERIKGLNFSYLYTSNSLTENQLHLFLNTLQLLHREIQSDITVEQVVAANKEKILERYNSYNYSKFFESRNTFDSIMDFFHNYSPAHLSMIHGDPVFTNVIVTEDNAIKLIDMRGKIGDIKTVFGDPLYDLSKVYQSLTGYDHILNGSEHSTNHKLAEVFEKFVNTHYDFDLNTIRKFTASLYFSLIPLHDDEKCELYYQMARQLIR